MAAANVGVMLRRLAVLTVAGAAGLCGVVSISAGASAPASTALSSPVPTSVVHVRPVDSHGNKLSDYTITKQLKHARCNAGSEAIGTAYRCFAGNFVLDPCWVQQPKRFAICLSEPWSFHVVQLKVSKGYHGALSKHGRSQPWGVQLANGTQCGFGQGATGTVGGKRINYFCAHAKYVLIGKIDKHGKVWHARKAKPTGGGHYKAAGRVGLTKAWFGKPSRHG